MTEATRAALWRSNRTARRAAVQAAKAARVSDPAAVAAMNAAWEPVRLAQQERFESDPLDECQDEALQSPNEWTPGLDEGC